MTRPLKNWWLPLCLVVPFAMASQSASAAPSGGEQEEEKSTDVHVEDVQAGTGETLNQGKVATFRYSCTLDGADTAPVSPEIKELSYLFGGNRMIQGWNQGVEGMREGERRAFTVPPSLAYGAMGRSPSIPPNSTLRFEVELVRVEPAPEGENA